MPDTYDLTTDVGKVRLLIPDSDISGVVLFHDADLEALLDLEGDVRRAAAQALDIAASNEAMVLKVIDTLDLKTDGSKVSAELRARAKVLREQADSEEDFAIAEYADGVFGIRERYAKQAWMQSL